MQGHGSRRIAAAAEVGPRGGLPSWVGKPIMGLALCLLAAGCASVGRTLTSSAPARDVSIAFESIDGLPRDLSQRLVRDLDEEAAARRIAVVPAGGEATYRLRVYLAAQAQGSTTSIVWAWDVYDAELHRAFRLSGEERAGPAAGRATAGRKAEVANWAALDEALLRAIARAGMEQLAGFVASPPAPAAPPAPAPTRNGSEVVASRDDPRSETAGSFRGEPAGEPHTAPLPQRRPALAESTRPTLLVEAPSGR